METYHRITFYGMLQEKITRELPLKISLKNVSEIRSYLEENYPILRTVPYLVAINKVISPPENPLKPGDDIAILPPFSGG